MEARDTQDLKMPFYTTFQHRPGGLAILLCAAAAGCEEPPQANAAEEARIERGMKEVAAGQARSEINVAEVKAREGNRSEGNE